MTVAQLKVLPVPSFFIFAILPPRHLRAKRAYPGYAYQCGARRLRRMMSRDIFKEWQPTSMFGHRQKRKKEKQASPQRATQIASLIAEADSGFDTEYTQASTFFKGSLNEQRGSSEGITEGCGSVLSPCRSESVNTIARRLFSLIVLVVL